jgi:hypothetical protein
MLVMSDLHIGNQHGEALAEGRLADSNRLAWVGYSKLRGWVVATRANEWSPGRAAQLRDEIQECLNAIENQK